MITFFDGLLGSFYFLVIMIIGWMYSKQRISEGKLNYKYYLPSLFVHLFGVIFFCLVYGFYYGGGDSYYYFRGGAELGSYLLENPLEGFKILSNNLSDLNVDSFRVLDLMNVQNDEDSFLMMKLASVITIFGFKSFLGTSLITAYISFLINWYLFKSVNKLFFLRGINSPKLYYVLFIPSLFFWGTGVLKDTFVFIFATYIIVFFIQVFDFKRHSFIIIKLLFFTLASYFVYSLKAYVFFTILIALILSYYSKIVGLFEFINSNKLIKYSLNITLIGLLSIFSFFGFQAFQSDIISAQMSTINTLQGFHDWHTKLGGSSYSLGITDYSIVGLIQKAPIAFLVTYFGPFPWQINSSIMLITGVESYVFFYLTIKLIVKKRFSLFTISKQNSFVMFTLIFSILFGVLVGITSYNYGALARFKIQSLPYFLIWILNMNFFDKSQAKK